MPRRDDFRGGVSDEEQLVRRLLDAHNRGGEVVLESYDDMLDSEFEFMPMTVGVVGSLERATYRGREGVRRYYEERAEAFGAGEVQIRSVEPAGDGALLVHARSTAQGRGSGAVVEEEITLVYWVRGGKVVRGQAFRSRGEAMEAAHA